MKKQEKPGRNNVNMSEILNLLDKQKQLLIELKADQSTREREGLYTEAEVREIAKAFDTWDGLSFDKWWQGTELNKANLK